MRTAGTRIHGTGEMAERVRQKDWSATPLGPIENWSETLVSSVNMLLLCPLSFAMYWGDELTLIYNDTYKEFLGSKHPEALGMPGAVVWSEAWDVLGPSVRGALYNGETMNAREALIPILTDGVLKDRWWTYGFYPLYEDGRIKGVANPGNENTSAVLAHRALQESEGRLRLALQAANAVGTWDWDVVQDRVYADEAFARLYGVDPSIASQGASIQEFFRNIHPDDMVATGPLIQKTIENGGHFSAEYRVVQPDGSLRWVSALGHCLMDEEGKASRFPGVSVDITEKKRQDHMLLHTEKLAAVGKLASSIAHEINNPVEAVMNLLYLARTADDREEIEGYLESAERELQRVSQITMQTLRFHKQTASPVAASADELFESVLNLYLTRMLNQGVVLEKEQGTARPVMCFEGEIRQVLGNLVGNALDALEAAGGGRLILRSREGTNWKSGAHSLILTIADSAGGMPPEVMKRVFEAFFTTKGVGGTGLGLWVSEEIVARHHGRMLVRSSTRQGRSGTVFLLFLPYDEAPLQGQESAV